MLLVVSLLLGNSSRKGKWFKTYGADLCMTLFVNTFLSHLYPVQYDVLTKAFERYRDRGKRPQSELKDGDDGVFTKQVLQSDLEALYTDAEIAASGAYGKYFSVLWSIMTFSSGCTMVYPIGCLYFTYMYWVHKYLLLKKYSKTTGFDHQLCFDSMPQYFFAVYVHIQFSYFCFRMNLIACMLGLSTLLG
jgi:hypothetical protein